MTESSPSPDSTPDPGSTSAQQPRPDGPGSPDAGSGYGQQHSQPYDQYAQPHGQQYAQPYGQAPGYAYRPSQPTNTMAIISLIAGIAGLTIFPFIASIVAVVTGHMARKEISRTGEQGGGLATGGLVTGWVGIGLGVAIVLFFVFMLTFGFGIFATVATATSGV